MQAGDRGVCPAVLISQQLLFSAAHLALGADHNFGDSELGL